MCPPMRAHWCHLVNTVELEHPSAHFSPQPKRENDRFSHFCTAYGRNSLQWATYSPELPILMGDLDPQHITPWGHVSPKHKGHVDRLGRFCTADCRMSVYFTMVRPFLPQIIIIIIIIINQFLTRQMPVSQVLRRGGRYATSQFGLIIKSKCNIEQMCL